MKIAPLKSRQAFAASGQPEPFKLACQPKTTSNFQWGRQNAHQLKNPNQQNIKQGHSKDVKYDPEKNLLLSRNMLVIKRQLWEDPIQNIKQQQQKTISFLKDPSSQIKRGAVIQTQNVMITDAAEIKSPLMTIQSTNSLQNLQSYQSMKSMKPLELVDCPGLGTINQITSPQTDNLNIQEESEQQIQVPTVQGFAQEASSRPIIGTRLSSPPLHSGASKRFMSKKRRPSAMSQNQHQESRKLLQKSVGNNCLSSSTINVTTTATCEQPMNGQISNPKLTQCQEEVSRKVVEFKSCRIMSLHPQTQSNKNLHVQNQQTQGIEMSKSPKKFSTFTVRAKSATVRGQATQAAGTCSNDRHKESQQTMSLNQPSKNLFESNQEQANTLRMKPYMRRQFINQQHQVSLMNEDIHSIADMQDHVWNFQNAQENQQEASDLVKVRNATQPTPLQTADFKPQMGAVTPKNGSKLLGEQTQKNQSGFSSASKPVRRVKASNMVTVRQHHVRRAQLIANSHQGHFKTDSNQQEEQTDFLIQTNNGCQIQGNSQTELAVAMPQNQLTAKKTPKRPFSAANKRIKGSTVSNKVGRDNSVGPHNHTPCGNKLMYPIFALMPTMSQKRPTQIKARKSVYRLILDQVCLKQDLQHHHLDTDHNQRSSPNYCCRDSFNGITTVQKQYSTSVHHAVQTQQQQIASNEGMSRRTQTINQDSPRSQVHVSQYDVESGNKKCLFQFEPFAQAAQRTQNAIDTVSSMEALQQ